MEQESPASPDNGELLFVEDRQPGSVTPLIRTFKESEDYIKITDNTKSSENAKSSENKKIDCDKTDAAETVDLGSNIKDQLIEDLLPVIEDRNPILTGQEIQSPKYHISEKFLKIHEPNSSARRNKLANPCFNCGNTDHPVRDCPLPRNNAEISRNRREFQSIKGPGGNKRYHAEYMQEFSHLVPGELSDELRKALGVSTKELPSFVYHMRRLGYPPAWLEEARISHSGIRIFDGKDSEIEDPSIEVGQVIENDSLDKYDLRKIYRWPGFNVPPTPDTYDDSKYWKCPPMSRTSSVETMLEWLSGRLIGGYKRKKLSLLPADDEKLKDTIESHDMEYEETPEGADLPADSCGFVPPLPDEELPPPPPTDLPAEPSEDTHSSMSDIEVSLIELEDQKKALLAQLNDTTPLCSTPNSRVGQVKSVELGTPILQSVSPFARLPSAEKFSVNICDVINFENLPDSTGNYEKMSGIIRNVRHKLSTIDSED